MPVCLGSYSKVAIIYLFIGSLLDKIDSFAHDNLQAFFMLSLTSPFIETIINKARSIEEQSFLFRLTVLIQEIIISSFIQSPFISCNFELS